MSNTLMPVRKRDERGMTTAEYAVGTLATVSVVGVLLAIISDPAFKELIWKLIRLIFDIIMKSVG